MTHPLPLNLHMKTTHLVLALLLAALLATLSVPVARAEGITVTRGDDATGTGDGCTLREAIPNANNDNQSGSTDCPAGNGADTITFAGNYTITLGSALPALAGTLTVDGAGQSVAVSGNNAVRVFVIQAGAVVTISHLSLISGTGGADLGGGIHNSGTLAVLNSTLSGNSATFGGGIHNGGMLAVTNSTLSGNRAPGGPGGGIHNSGTLTVTNSILSSNLASHGGGILNSGGTLAVTNSTLSGNSAGLGGGLYNDRQSSAMLRVTNSTLSGNSAGVGGGLYNDAMLRVTNSTFSGNSANAGGGIYNSNGTLHLHNSLIANSPRGGDCQNQGTIATNVNNLIENGSCNPALSGDPNLGPLQDNGGVPTSTGLPPFTHALLFPSPAIDVAGDCAPFLDPDQDQRGVVRPLDGDGNGNAACDIGAYEAPLPPDLEVWGNGLLIASGDTSPSLNDGTDFGTATAGGVVTHTFVISNSGGNDLLLTGSPLMTISGASVFSLAAAPATPISGGASTLFQVRFEPTATGPVTATLTIASNDPDENPYTFTLQGTSCFNAITVTSTGDSGPGTLRQALAEVCSGGVIDFAAGLANQTISLSSAELTIAKTVTITNPNAAKLAVSGNNTVQIFTIQAGAVVTISHLSLISGTATFGGSINNEGTLTVLDSTLSGNSAIDGGGLYNGGALTITGSTLSGNLADGNGGGIRNTGTLTITGSTLSDNSADFGAGLYNDGALHLRNSLIANSADGVEDCQNAGTILTNINNLIEDESCSSGATGFVSGDPNLGPLSDNGGPTPTHALLPGSPAINAGEVSSCLTVDQRGIARPQLGDCDIGAFESRGFTLTLNGGNHQTTLANNTFPVPLGLTVTSSDPVSGGLVTLTAPDTGPSLTLAPTATITISGSAVSLQVTANGTAGGPYLVIASTRGGNLVTFTLTNSLKITPTVTVTSSLNPSTVGQAVTFTATVSSAGTSPTGSLSFVIDGIAQPPVNLIAGQAAFLTTALSIGLHSVGATYNGDDNFYSTSDSLPGGQVVKPKVVSPTIQFSQTVYLVTEGESQALVLSRSGDLSSVSQVQVSLNGGTASGGTDYSVVGFPKIVTFGSGVVSQTLAVELIDDVVAEPTETIRLKLSSLSNALIGGQPETIVQIEDNDVASVKVYLPLVIK